MKLPPSLIPNIFSNLVTALTTGLLKGITVTTDTKKTKLNYSVNVDNSSIKVNEDNNLEIIESDPIFSAWDKSTGVSITESQISDLKEYLTEEIDPVFSASQAANITSEDITKLSNLSGVNTGDQDLSEKQDVLVSGTNIKTINSTSLLGSGDIVISGGGSSTFKYGYYTLSADQTTGLANNDFVKIDTVIGSLGSPSSYGISLTANKTYKITFTASITGSAYFIIYQTTAREYVGQYILVGSTSFSTTATLVYKPISDCVIKMQIVNPSNLTRIHNVYNTFILVEEYGGY